MTSCEVTGYLFSIVFWGLVEGTGCAKGLLSLFVALFIPPAPETCWERRTESDGCWDDRTPL